MALTELQTELHLEIAALTEALPPFASTSATVNPAALNQRCIRGNGGMKENGLLELNLQWKRRKKCTILTFIDYRLQICCLIWYSGCKVLGRCVVVVVDAVGGFS